MLFDSRSLTRNEQVGDGVNVFLEAASRMGTKSVLSNRIRENGEEDAWD